METPRTPCSDTVTYCLEKILQDPTFATSDRLSAFLRYIVTETLADRGSRLKGYNVALSVFSRGEKFDPQTNSVVRVEATRLRKQLAAYYAGPGASDPIEIRVNRGSYVPEFIERSGSAPPPAVDTEALAVESSPLEHPIARSPRMPWLLAGATLVALFVAIAALAYRVGQASYVEETPIAIGPIWSQPPSIAVAQLELPPESGISQFQASALAREVAAGLGRFEIIRVREVDPDATAAPGTEYVLAGGVGRGGGERHNVSFRLIRAGDNQIIWSKTYDHLPSDLTADHRLKIVADLANTLARTHGVIFVDRYRQTPISAPIRKVSNAWSTARAISTRQHDSPSMMPLPAWSARSRPTQNPVSVMPCWRPCSSMATSKAIEPKPTNPSPMPPSPPTKRWIWHRNRPARISRSFSRAFMSGVSPTPTRRRDARYRSILSRPRSKPASAVPMRCVASMFSARIY